MTLSSGEGVTRCTLICLEEDVEVLVALQLGHKRGGYYDNFNEVDFILCKIKILPIKL